VLACHPTLRRGFSSSSAAAERSRSGGGKARLTLHV